MAVGLLGAGKMGRAFFDAFKKHHAAPVYIRASTAASTAIKAESWPAEDGWIDQSWHTTDAWIIGVKPAQYREAILPLMPIYHARKENPPTIVSLMAGIRLQSLAEDFSYSPILRVMANLSIAHTHGVYAVSKTNTCSVMENQLSQMGQVLYFDDLQMDVATALLGSSPAVMLKMIQSFTDAGVAQGLSSEASGALVGSALTATGSLIGSGDLPKKIIKNIASPNGTTQAMLNEVNDMSLMCNRAVEAACERAKVLAQAGPPKLS